MKIAIILITTNENAANTIKSNSGIALNAITKPAITIQRESNSFFRSFTMFSEKKNVL